MGKEHVGQEGLTRWLTPHSREHAEDRRADAEGGVITQKDRIAEAEEDDVEEAHGGEPEYLLLRIVCRQT